MTPKPIAGRAEVALDFPDKAYVGSFSRASAFEVETDAEGVRLRLVRTGEEKRIVELHLHWYLLADILTELGRVLPAREIDASHRAAIQEAAALHAALAASSEAGSAA